MKLKNICLGVLVGLFVSLFFGLWLVWFIGNEKAAAKCGEDLQACRAAYCAQCLTDSECESYCRAFED